MVTRVDAHFSVKLLESLSCCQRLVVVLVEGRIKRAYRVARRDGGETRFPAQAARGRARVPGFADVVLRRRSYKVCR